MKTNYIYHGDCINVMQTFPDNIFKLVIADPPYNIGKDFGNNKDLMPIDEYVEWSKQWIKECLRILSNEGIMYVYGFSEILARVSVQYPLENQRWLIWHYRNRNTPNSKFWQRSHESLLCLWKGKRPSLLIDNIRVPYEKTTLKLSGKTRKNVKGRFNLKGKTTIYNMHENGALPRDVITIPCLAAGKGQVERYFLCKTCDNTLYSPENLKEHKGHVVLQHPTQKPLDLSKKLIKSIMQKDDKVLIPFAGSGSECFAAKMLGYNFIGIEINNEYVYFANEWLKTL